MQTSPDFVLQAVRIRLLQIDKETRFRTLKERQNEERQRKLEEIKAQALAAQIFKEQKENERRRRFDELRTRDDAKRQQVEERKRAINEAEKDRLEFILRKNQQREQRLETKKKNERSSAVFAFGSSTPRMLDPNDVSASFWGTRRATSIQNIVTSTNSSTLTRRQSERDLDAGNKKRATSATGLERTGEKSKGTRSRNLDRYNAMTRSVGSAPVIPAGCASGYSGRRRTDLVPTIPSKESISSSRKSLNHSPASSRPSSSLSQQSTNSLASSVNVRQRLTTGPRKPRPISIAVTGISTDAKNDNKPPIPKTRKTITKTTTTAINSDKINRNKAKTPVDSVTKTLKNTTTATVTGKDKLQEETTSNQKSEEHRVPPNKIKPDIVNGEVEFNVPQNKRDIEVTSECKLESNNGSINVELGDGTIKTLEIEKVELNKKETNDKTVTNTREITESDKEESTVSEAKTDQLLIDVQISKKEDVVESIKSNSESKIPESEKPEIQKTPIKKEQTNSVEDQKSLEDEKNRLNISTSQTLSENSLIDQINMESQENEMTTSMTKVRINTEKEAKAALAERRRLIREEAERQAELERLRLEAEAKAELERQQREEEQIRQLIELQRQAEQERLQEAIREAQKREEEERLKREEEQKLKLLKEEAERKAKEDAEKQKAELQERLKNEEKEREARRKRVEAIMLRTRGKNANNTQSTDEKNENKPAEEMKSNEENKINGTKIDEQENGTTKVAKDIVDNLIPNEIVKNANSVTIESMNTNDSINSNNTWRDNQQYGNFMCNNNS
ncbi:calponin homology domain-containing protein DDB_G0272472 isoform X7 [Diorhabda carinulata]|uniref:calponin homology domain-containing protein DDB_G0272472 isoform X7 n=1 Tax=Diorhabda carinulata TaxID=1163345 RepID=UPI0025A0D490|nr:calponin homology domain-containing protein DDB_G0272472 isoform X7 [Diorhabda carinulata]